MPDFRCRVRAIFQISAILLVCILAAVQASSATNIATTTATYQFTGQCSDCSGTGIGQLTVQNYTLGQPLNNTNFVSFSYSSNLVSYTVGSGNFLNLTGTLPASLPAPATVEVQGSNYTLLSNASGAWSVGGTQQADTGSSSTWGLPGSTVPALSVPAMIGLAAMMGLLGAFLLKRFPYGNAA